VSKILILGGTRFLGRALCEHLALNGNEVLVSSRRRMPIVLPIAQYTCERLELKISKIDLSEFDYVIDFTAYNPKDLEMLPNGIPNLAYILISTDWVSKLSTFDFDQSAKFSERDFHYTLNKSLTEKSATDKFKDKTLVLRLPVALGLNDHHNRLGFYGARAQSNRVQLLVEDDFPVSYILVHDFISACQQILSSSYQLPQTITARSKTESYNNLIHKLNTMFKKTHSVIKYTSLPRSEISRNFPVFAFTDPLLYEDLTVASDSHYIISESNFEYMEKFIEKISMTNLTDLQLQAIEEERRGLND
jgi:dTDP-4-dehydrorhamnose reductase